MILMRPVLEVYAPDGFSFWPVAEFESFGHLALSGALTHLEVGAAVMRIAATNDVDPEHDDRPLRPAEPLESFLHGLLTIEALFVPGGMRIVDNAAGTAFLPGCCNGLEDWRDWYQVLDGNGCVWFGHDPDARAELRGDTVLLTTDAERDDSPMIHVPADELRSLLVGALRDLADFLTLAADWAEQHLPGHATRVVEALHRALDLPPSTELSTEDLKAP